MEILETGFVCNKKLHEHDWEPCPGSGRFIRFQDKRAYVRCPVCKKRLFMKETHHGEEYGYSFYIPKHKPKLKKKKTTKKNK